MRKPSPRISRTLRLLVSGILLVWLISRVGYTELVDAIASSDATWMALAIASVLPSYAIRSFSLHTITNKNGRVVTYGQSFSLTLVGVASSLFLPPGVADAARAHIGYRALGKPETVVSATLLDRATSLVALGMLGAVAAYLEGATLAAMISGAIGLAALVAVAIPRLLPWAWVIKIISGGAKIDPDRVVDAARMPPLTLAWVLTISMGGWLFSALSVFLVSRSLGADIAFATVTVATLLASLSRLIPISAAGIGVGEWALALYLTRAGIADERAAAIALVTMVVATILPGIFGLTVKLRRSDSANATSELASLSVNDAVIRPMRLADVPAVVDVHTSQLGGSLLDELGAGFLMLYYEHLASTPHGVTLVAEDTARDRIVGLCAGTATSDSVYLDMARAHLWRTLGLTTARLLTHPGAVLRAISAARSKQHSPTDSLQGTRRAGDATSGSTEFVLQTIAVAPEAEGKGLGSAMLQTFIELARASDADSVSLMTEEDGNDRVHKLYEAAGFRSTGKRVGSGSRKVIAYELELDGPE